MGVREALEIAQELDQLGFCVLPAKFKGKAPLVSWKKYQSRKSSDDLLELFGFDQDYNFWIACGSISSCVVLDCDNDEAVAFWAARLGRTADGKDDLLWTTTRVKTAKGYHFYFRLAEGQPFESWSFHEAEEGVSTTSAKQPSFDVRGDGTGVVAPPSVHLSGQRYEWEIEPDQMQPVPDALFKAAVSSNNGSSNGSGKGKRTNLAELLALPPSEGGRNVWLTAVAGHYAKQIRFEDAFRATVEGVNAGLRSPLATDEVEKILDSIWNSEQNKPLAPDATNGFLVALPGHQLGTQVKIKDPSSEDGFRVEIAAWSNFDIQAQGVIFDEKGRRSYVVTILQEGEPPRQDLLEPQTLARPAELAVWLSGHGCTVMAPLTDPRKSQTSQRLQRYLESQEPQEYRGVAHLGYHEGIGWVAHEGIITKDGLIPHEGVMPHPRLKSWAPYKYGFAKDTKEVVRVIKDVLTFQDPTVTAVYASWWCANILKGLEGFGSAHWPAMVIEASSESGKTRGFFAVINQLFGCTLGGGESTMAATRDALSAHRNGLVWADDLEDPTGLMELVRQATSEGSKSKKGMDRSSQETVKLVSPICISGESMGAIMAEKAQRDRAIRLTVPSPIGRRSIHGDYPQYDDIEDLLNRYGRDLSRLAGSVVQLVLQNAELVKEFRTLRGDAGRHNDKHGVLRVGARVLASITKSPKIIELVDAWCAEQENLGDENVLTTLVLPQLLTQELVPSNAYGAPPVFYRDGVVWFHTQRVVLAWQKLTRFGDRARDLVSQASVTFQLKALGATRGQRWTIEPRLKHETPKQMRYHALPEELSSVVIARVDSVASRDIIVIAEKTAQDSGRHREMAMSSPVSSSSGSLKKHPLPVKKHPRNIKIK